MAEEPPRVKRGTLTQFLLPDLATMLAVATLGYCLFVFGAGQALFRDADAGWHIRNGEWILAHFTLPHADPYSFSKPGADWVAWEWGSDVLMGVADRADGLRGVTELMALAIAAGAWLCFRLHFAVNGDFFLTALLAPLIVTTSSLHWLARPHVFGWLFLLGAVLCAERVAAGGRARPWLAAAGTALWANLHASFFLGPLVALVYAVSHWLGPVLWRIDPGRERRKARGFLVMALASAAGSLVNPYGWRLHAHVITYLTDNDLTSRIAEFQSFNFHDKDATQVTLAVLVAMVGGVLAFGQRRLAHGLLAMLFVFGALRYARLLPVVALVILPLANGAITEALREASGLRPAFHRALDRALEYTGRLRAIDQRVYGTVFALATTFIFLSALHTPVFAKQIGFPAARFPVKAAQAVDRLPVSARLLAPDSFGGYLIYRFDGERKVYFDGRSDFYGVAFMKQYLSLITVRPGWREVVKTFRFTHALLPHDAPLSGALADAGWKTLYQDQVATLMEAP